MNIDLLYVPSCALKRDWKSLAIDEDLAGDLAFILQCSIIFERR